MSTEREQAFNRFSNAVDGPLTVLSILWLPVLIIPLVHTLHGATAATFDLVDYVVWALFVAEYLVKLCLAPRRWQYVRTHLLDLAIVAIPFLRPLRVLRVLRAGTVLGGGARRLRSILTHHGLHFVLLFATVLVFACAGLELSFEARAPGANIHDYGSALWWAVVTVTTVGYGDRYPVTAGGRGVAVVLMLVGIGLIGVVTASVASFFVEEKSSSLEDEVTALRAQLDRIEAMLQEQAR